jgi:hypothetical protein
LATASEDDIGCKRDQFRRVSANAGDIAPAPPVVEPHVAAFDPAQCAQPLQERRDAGLPVRVVRSLGHKNADASSALRRLCPCRERPRDNRAAEQRDDLAAFPLTESHGLPTSQAHSQDTLVEWPRQ